MTRRIRPLTERDVSMAAREQGFFDPPPDEPGDFDWPQWQGPAR